MVIFFIAMLTIFSIQRPFIVYANQERSKTGKINHSFSAQCIFLAVSLSLYFVVIVLFADQIASFAKIARADLVFVSLAFIGVVVKTFVFNLFMALGQRIRNALAGVTYNALAILFIIGFYLTDNINLHSVFLVYFLSNISLVFFFVKAFDFKLLFPFRFDPHCLKQMLDFTKWVMFGVTAAYFINWGDNLVLKWYSVPMADIGIYNFSYQIFKGLVFLIAALGQYFLPFISQHINNKEKLRNYLFVKRPKIIVLGLIALVGTFFLIPYLLRLLYGSVYLRSELVLQILLIAGVITLYTVFYNPIFNALKKYKFFGIATLIQLAINVILDFVFIPYMGILGAAVATVIAYFCRAVIIEIYFRLYIRNQLNL